MDGDWERCDAEAVATALSARFRSSRANAVQLLRDEGTLILRPHAEADEDDDIEEAEGWCSEEEEVDDVIIPMPGQDLVSAGAVVVGAGEWGFQDGAAAAAMFRVRPGAEAQPLEREQQQCGGGSGSVQQLQRVKGGTAGRLGGGG